MNATKRGDNVNSEKNSISPAGVNTVGPAARLIDAAIAAYRDHYSTITQYALINATRAYLRGEMPNG